ncbi:Hypothetical protein CINCED_3A017380 [Cinara cedri]|uniref:Uncharacterized protein n=1 Tax=Cinara cedri TaxID=506608 RepID=A0A5E4NNZ2_9HEMI|nr:Hypothetical protein CINCED_3A017380 [Cinara cedri]
MISEHRRRSGVYRSARDSTISVAGTREDRERQRGETSPEYRSPAGHNFGGEVPTLARPTEIRTCWLHDAEKSAPLLVFSAAEMPVPSKKSGRGKAVRSSPLRNHREPTQNLMLAGTLDRGFAR